MLIEDVQDDPHVQHVAEKLLDILANPVVVNERHYTLTASIGISLYPKDGTTRHELLQRADTAMYEAKSKGRSRYWF